MKEWSKNDRRWYWPLPTNELVLNENLKQNPEDGKNSVNPLKIRRWDLQLPPFLFVTHYIYSL